MRARTVRQAAAVLGLFLVVVGGRFQVGAHGPFDNSVALYVTDERLEAGITLGMEGARQALKHAGMKPAAVDEALLVRGAASASDLDVAVASGLFELSNGSAPVSPTHASVCTDGLEVLIAMVFPRIHGSRVKIHALYFDAVEELPPGAFLMLDENRNTLGAATVSRLNPTVDIPLPGRAVVAAGPAARSAMALPVHAASVGEPSPTSFLQETAVSSILPAAGWVAGGVLLGSVFWFGRRRLLSPGSHSRHVDS
jgi:hypothetical protein